MKEAIKLLKEALEKKLPLALISISRSIEGYKIQASVSIGPVGSIANRAIHGSIEIDPVEMLTFFESDQEDKDSIAKKLADGVTNSLGQRIATTLKAYK